MTLPVITVTLRRKNPNWKPIYEDGNGRPVNMSDWQIEMPTEVEVVQLNLNTGGMRVRWSEPDPESKKGYTVESRDISIEHFYKHYEITKK